MTDADADRLADEPERDARLGTEVDRYTIVRLLGKGGMGRVYEARHTRLARRMAIKFLLADMASRSEILRRFENEAMAAGRLEHPNLVAVTDLGRAADGAPYLVMEYLEGEDCARLLRRAGPLPVVRTANIVVQACRGIAVAHRAGIVHRDLKPENLFLVDAGDGSDQVKVLDFGIAKLRPAGGEAATRTGSVFGTTHYMSPEQARGSNDIDARTDVWSLGVVLFELLAGKKPFDGEQPLNVVHQILSAEAPSLEELRPGLPAGLVAAVGKALQKDADKRFPTIEALAAALAPFAGRAPAHRRPAAAALTATQPTPATAADDARRGRPSGLLRVGMAFAMGAGMGILALSLARPRGAPEAPAPSPPVAPVTAAAPPAAPPVAPFEQSGRAEPAAPSEGPPPPSNPAPAVVHEGEPTPVAQARRRPSVTAARPRGSETKPAAGATPAGSADAPALKLDPNPY